MNLGTRMARCHFFRGIEVLFTASGWLHRGERILAACIRLRHTSLSPDVMARGGIGHTSRSPLVCNNRTLNSVRYISGVLRPVDLPFVSPAEPYISSG
ncbi:hypothetical protein TNCV_4168251 [Trichonephila clavipes]|nr:hypothetical protein TNCV_4168251 [Trichonephila clavipes]